jgi:outer membrane protein OmpA-like peptidoglycan-associated protein
VASVRLALLVLATAVLAAGGCGQRKPTVVPEIAPVTREPDLVVLVPDPGTGSVGFATVSNASGRVELSAAGASTTIVVGQPPAPATIMRDSDIRAAFGAVLASLPEAPSHFTLYFVLNSDQLTAQSRADLADVIKAVSARPVPEVLVVGHTDTTGPAAANVVLGMRRATVVRDALVDSGLDPALIEVDSHGESDLLVPTADGVDEPMNRRVEIIVR